MKFFQETPWEQIGQDNSRWSRNNFPEEITCKQGYRVRPSFFYHFDLQYKIDNQRIHTLAFRVRIRTQRAEGPLFKNYHTYTNLRIPQYCDQPLIIIMHSNHICIIPRRFSISNHECRTESKLDYPTDCDNISLILGHFNFLLTNKSNELRIVPFSLTTTDSGFKIEQHKETLKKNTEVIVRQDIMHTTAVVVYDNGLGYTNDGYKLEVFSQDQQASRKWYGPEINWSVWTLVEGVADNDILLLNFNSKHNKTKKIFIGKPDGQGKENWEEVCDSNNELQLTAFHTHAGLLKTIVEVDGKKLGSNVKKIISIHHDERTTFSKDLGMPDTKYLLKPYTNNKKFMREIRSKGRPKRPPSPPASSRQPSPPAPARHVPPLKKDTYVKKYIEDSPGVSGINNYLSSYRYREDAVLQMLNILSQYNDKELKATFFRFWNSFKNVFFDERIIGFYATEVLGFINEHPKLVKELAKSKNTVVDTFKEKGIMAQHNQREPNDWSFCGWDWDPDKKERTKFLFDPKFAKGSLTKYIKLSPGSKQRILPFLHLDDNQ